MSGQEPARSPNAVRCARWRARNLDRERARNREYNARVKAAVLDHYGRSCSCCGATDDLTIDHLDGKGREHRIELFRHQKRGGKPMYVWLVKRGFPPGYSVLCRRCNTSKSRTAACRLHASSDERAA